MADSVALPSIPAERPWWREVTWYHWTVLLLAACGWLFDCMGQRIFVLAREPALRELLGATASDGDLKYVGGVATMILMIGWATGGILFGIFSDKYGRVKAMVVTLLAYTIFAGLSGLARNSTEFLVYRFLCGLGVGGMFGSATTLLAESVTPRFRTFALGIMQSLSAVGNILASGVSMGIVLGKENFWGHWSGWQILFFVGVLPVVLIVPIVVLLKEPEPWKKAKAEAAAGRGKKMGSYGDLLANPTWYYTAIIAAACGIGLMLLSLAPASWPRPPIKAMLALVIVAASFWTIAGNRHGSMIALTLILISMGLVAFQAPATWPKPILLLFMAVLAVITAYFVVRFFPHKESPAQIRWRKSTHIGICFGVAGMVGLWGIAFFSPELITAAFKNRPLLARELVQPATIFAGLKAPANSGVVHVKAQLSPDMQKLVDQVDPAAALPAGAQETLLTDLNRLIQTTNLYNAEAFQAVTLTKGTSNLAQLVQAKGEKPDIIQLNRQLVEQLFPGAIAELQRTIDKCKSRGTLLQDVGSMLGMLTFTWVASRFNRRTAFFLSFVFCGIAVAFVFYSLKRESDVYWMLPLMGFGTLSAFAGYSIYFPEIFPTRLRGTGVGFCYNTVRYFAAPFPMLLGWLTMSTTWSFRNWAMVMCLIYLVGIVALIWAPETKGKPLPED
jgi:MFS family permease